LLLSALLSPRDEDELIGHLRTLNAHHLQTHPIPQLASALAPGEKRRGGGLFSSFRKKKDPEPVVVGGCDPDLFAEEIRTYLPRAKTKKRERQDSNGMAPDMRLGPMSERAAMPQVAETAPEPAGASSSWDDPFAWKPSGVSARGASSVGDPFGGVPEGTSTPPRRTRAGAGGGARGPGVRVGLQAGAGVGA